MSYPRPGRPSASPKRRQAPGATTRLKLSRAPRYALALCLLLGWPLLLGCSGKVSTPLYYTADTAPQVLTTRQVMAQQAARQQTVQQPTPPAPGDPMPAATPHALQQQLMMQAAQSSRTNYKDYQVGPEDLLFIDVYGQEGLRRELRVNGQGLISMPLVGVVKVGGLSTQEIENRLREAYGSQYLRNPQVTVEVKEFHHQRVAVTGAVIKPGFYDIIGPRTIMEVLSMAGGLSSKPGPEAGDAIHLIRNRKASDQGKTGTPVAGQYYSPQTRTLVLNLHRLVNGQSPELNVMVENGDVISVPFAGTAYVLGGVRKPGNVTVNNNLTVSQAVAMAQGVDPMYGTTKITVMRFDDQGMPTRIEADLKEITAGREPDLPVKGNDAIVVKEGELKTKLYVWRQILPIPSGGYAIPTR
jgi:polysaccharide biosynthesis/export protein